MERQKEVKQMIKEILSNIGVGLVVVVMTLLFYILCTPNGPKLVQLITECLGD